MNKRQFVPVLAGILLLASAVPAVAQLPPRTNPNLAHYGYYHAINKFGDYSGTVFPYTNLFIAIPDAMADTSNPNWQTPFVASLQTATAAGKSIYLIMMQKTVVAQYITYDEILDLAAPYWNNVAYLEVKEDNDHINMAQLEDRISNPNPAFGIKEARSA